MRNIILHYIGLTASSLPSPEFIQPTVNFPLVISYSFSLQRSYHASGSDAVCTLNIGFSWNIIMLVASVKQSLSFCTGHVVALNNVRACGCMLFLRPSDFVGDRPPKVCSDAWGRSFSPVIFIVWARNIQTIVCLGSGSPDLVVD